MKKAPTTISPQLVQHIAKLANIPVSDQESAQLAEAFTETLSVVENLKRCDVKNIEPTHQVAGLENILREDTVDNARMFSQAQALANAAQTHDGYFMVPYVLTLKDGGEA